MYTLIGTAKLNDVDPQAWLANSRQPPSRRSPKLWRMQPTGGSVFPGGVRSIWQAGS